MLCDNKVCYIMVNLVAAKLIIRCQGTIIVTDLNYKFLQDED